MQIYMIFRDNEESVPMRYVGSMSEARRVVSILSNPNWRIELVEIDADKESVLRMLNGGCPICTKLKTWYRGPRGGVELSNEED